jgi:hypothetical protein
VAYIKFLGTSDSQGVPRLFCECQVCLKRALKNIRMRPSLYMHTEDGHILIDVSPDFRQQFLQFSHLPIPRSTGNIDSNGDLLHMSIKSIILRRFFDTVLLPLSLIDQRLIKVDTLINFCHRNAHVDADQFHD